MRKRILYISLVLVLVYYIFAINLKLEILHIQIQEIGIIIQNINRKINNIPNFPSPNEQLYVKMKLKITAYSSEVCQTDPDPNIGAWGNKVKKGMVAVSRDLEAIGITNGVSIIIEGYEHLNTVILDKMGKYKTVKKKKIKIEKTLDLWMGSKQEALEWGVKYLTVRIPISCINFEKFVTSI